MVKHTLITLVVLVVAVWTRNGNAAPFNTSSSVASSPNSEDREILKDPLPPSPAETGILNNSPVSSEESPATRGVPKEEKRFSFFNLLKPIYTQPTPAPTPPPPPPPTIIVVPGCNCEGSSTTPGTSGQGTTTAPIPTTTTPGTTTTTTTEFNFVFSIPQEGELSEYD